MALNRLEQMLVDQYTNVNYPRMEPEPEPPAEGEMPFEPYQVAQAGPGVTGPGGAAFGVFPGAGRRRPENNSDIGQRMVQGAPDFAAGAARGFTGAALGLPGDVEKLGRFIYRLATDNQGGGVLDKFGRAAQSLEESSVLPSSEDLLKNGYTIPGTQITLPPLPAAVPPGTPGIGLTPQQRETAAGAGQFVGELVGDPVALVKGGKAAAKGAKAAGKALAPKAGEMLSDYMRRSGMQLDLMAYHGTPHRFDKFDSSKIGTGEGAQAYGYGLYFAENKGVASGYKTRLSDTLNVKGDAQPIEKRAGQMALTFGDNTVDGAIKWLSKFESAGANHLSPALTPELVKQVKQRFTDGSFAPGGALYTVDVPDALVAKMLDFDAPIGQQSPEIQALAQKYNLSMDDLGGDLLAAAEGKTPEGAKALREAGIPGVRYFDQLSRITPPVSKQELEQRLTQAEAELPKLKEFGFKADGQERVIDSLKKQISEYDSIYPDRTRNIVVFPGGEDQIKIIKTEGAK